MYELKSLMLSSEKYTMNAQLHDIFRACEQEMLSICRARYMKLAILPNATSISHVWQI